jgi:hypothetical protein
MIVDHPVDAVNEVRARLDLSERLGSGERARVEPEREAALSGVRG